MVEVRWTRQALLDMEHIADYIARDSEKFVSIQVERFFDAGKKVEHQIRIGKIVPELQNESIREIIEGYYRIVYRIVNDQQADILTVHHSRRLLSNNPAFKGKPGG